MFTLGALFLLLGYAGVYTGVANLLNGGNGPTFREALGFKTSLAPPGASKPNLTGQPPTQPVPPTGQRSGGGTF